MYDPKCEEFARVWLTGEHYPYCQGDIEALAQEIQNTIETFLEFGELRQ